MKWKNRELPFLGYHKTEKKVLRFVDKEGQWFIPDFSIPTSPNVNAPPLETKDLDRPESEIATKFIEIDKIDLDEKFQLIKNIFL